MITIIDSGVANIGSVLAACRRIGAPATATTDPDRIRAASALILPGVGAFGDGMQSLRRNGLVQAIGEAAAEGVPILGICLGMQLLAEVSEEFGVHQGLGLIPGRVLRLTTDSSEERLPNIGWCDVSIERSSKLFEGIETGSAFYFVHSYHLRCTDPADSVASITFGGMPVTVAVERGNIYGAQFHPEKSQDVGLEFLRNFLRYDRISLAHT